MIFSQSMTGGTFLAPMVQFYLTIFFNSETCLKSGKLTKPSSIFFAETKKAILKAIRHIKRYYRPGPFTIATDSLSALKAFEARKMDTKTIDD